MTNKTEKRFVAFRNEGEGKISGTIISFGDVARIGQFSERFEPNSIELRSDVIANLMHDRTRPVARTGAGLTIEKRGDRLTAEIQLPDTVYGREARELVDAGILRGFSMEFRARKERWEDRTRIVESAELSGLGIVDIPAYSASQIEARLAEAHLPFTRLKYRRLKI